MKKHYRMDLETDLMFQDGCFLLIYSLKRDSLKCKYKKIPFFGHNDPIVFDRI